MTAERSLFLSTTSRRDDDGAVGLASVEVGLRMRRRSVDHVSVAERELGPVPRTDDAAVLERPFGQRAAEVGAMLRERAHAAVLARDHHFAAIHFHALLGPLEQVIARQR